MNTKPAALIHAFRHPLLISSIGVLLINDHLLKVYSPSWLTGKLSDFAGLFFFPFLLALVLIRLMPDEERSLCGGLLLTGVAFTAIKTLPIANAGATWLVSQALGPSVHFALDPTDLLALIMLPAGWLFWKKLRVESGTTSPGRLAYAVMALGSLAAMATSPSPLPLGVTRLVVQEGQVYTVVGFKYSSENDAYYTLSEDGQAWSLVEQPSDALREAFKAPAPKMPITHCDPADPRVCYRVDGRTDIEESRDGGQTWQTAWQYPPGRESYQKRVGLPDYGPAALEQRFYDLAIVSKAGAAGTSGAATVVAAAGTQGVVVRRPGQTWQRMAVNGVKPALLQSNSLKHAFRVIDYEFIAAGAASLLAYTILSLLGRSYAQVGEDGQPSYSAWALHPALFVLAWAPTLLALWMAFPGSMVAPAVHSFVVFALLLMLAVLLLTALSGKGAQRKAGLLALLAVFAVLVLPVILFLLWALGVIVYYATALAITLALLLIIFSGSFYLVRRVLLAESEGA